MSLFTEKSPLINYSNTTFGGDIKLNEYLSETKASETKVSSSNQSAIKILTWLIIIVLTIYLIYKLYKGIVVAINNYYKKQSKLYFNNVHGDKFDQEAKNAIRYGEQITEPNALDHYRLGAVYLVNARNIERAHQHFNQALDQIRQGRVDPIDIPFILDRIDDYKDEFVDYPDVEDLPIQDALLAYYNTMHHSINNQRNKKINKDDPEYTQKTLLAKQQWHSDSQNVHDSSIHNDLKHQYQQVRNENAKVSDLQLKTYSDCCNWLKMRYQNDPVAYEKINKTLSYLDNNYPISFMPDAHEQDILTTVWQRIHHPDNKKSFNQLRDALGEAVQDCVEGDHVVCLSGRLPKVWQSLSLLDKNPEIGVLNTKQALRNEIYELSAKIVDDYVGENGSASDELKTAYNNNENTEQVKELTDCMRKQIDQLRDKYQERLPDTQLNLIIEECKSIV